jgi:hypothetical protein
MSYTNYHGLEDFGPASQIPKTEPDHLAPPPTYQSGPTTFTATGVDREYSRFDPRGWRLRTKILAALAVVGVIIAIIVGAYEGVKLNRYPNYYPLNYTLTDTYEGTNFFDNFQYWSAPDPTGGFVVYVLTSRFMPFRLLTITATKVSKGPLGRT